MKMLAGIALGFFLVPSLLGLMALFVWAATRFEVPHRALGAGGALGVATLIVIAAGVMTYVAVRS